MAISYNRILSLADGWVTFQWKGYANGGQSKTMTLDAVEFIRRFLVHVLAPGLVRIQHFGFLANRARKKKLVLCRSLLAARGLSTNPSSTAQRSEPSDSGEYECDLCPICKFGRLVSIEILKAEALLWPVLILQDTS